MIYLFWCVGYNAIATLVNRSFGCFYNFFTSIAIPFRENISRVKAVKSSSIEVDLLKKEMINAYLLRLTILYRPVSFENTEIVD